MTLVAQVVCTLALAVMLAGIAAFALSSYRASRAHNNNREKRIMTEEKNSLESLAEPEHTKLGLGPNDAVPPHCSSCGTRMLQRELSEFGEEPPLVCEDCRARRKPSRGIPAAMFNRLPEIDGHALDFPAYVSAIGHAVTKDSENAKFVHVHSQPLTLSRGVTRPGVFELHNPCEHEVLIERIELDAQPGVCFGFVRLAHTINVHDLPPFLVGEALEAKIGFNFRPGACLEFAIVRVRP